MIWIKKTSHTIFILLGLSLCLSKVYANKYSWGTDQLGLSVGLKYQSRLSKRGIITYDSWQLLPVVSADLFCNCLFVVGKSIHYKKQLTPWLRLRSRLALDATGDTPLVETGDTIATPKEKSNEISFGAEWTWQDRGEFGANFNKDVSSHYGSYIGVYLRQVIFAIPMTQSEIQPAIYLATGWGSRSHNQYLYTTSEASRTHFELAFQVGLSPQVDPLFPLFELKYSKLSDQLTQVQEPKNRTGFFSLSAIMAKKMI